MYEDIINVYTYIIITIKIRSSVMQYIITGLE